MKWEQLFIFILMITSFWLFWDVGEDISPREEVFVSRILDGDTVEISGGVKIRLKGVNTPENNMFLYEEAKDFLAKLVKNQTVDFEFVEEDKYGRKLGYLFVKKKNVNELILEEGLGHLYYYEQDEYYGDLKKAEDKARNSEKGIWLKSENYGCLELTEFVYFDLTDQDKEKLVLENVCSDSLEVIIKDDATHIYSEVIETEFVLETQNIWNDDGDSIYVWDSDGLILFKRY